MALVVGHEARVAVAVATLWARPDAVRPADALALGVRPDPRRWVAGMSDAQRVDPCVLSQLLLGDPVLVLELHGGWARVVAPGQAAPDLDPRGYPGWVAAEQLAPGAAAPGPRFVVDATATALRDGPDGDVAVPGVMMGTFLTGAGLALRGWQPVTVPGRDAPLWALARDLAPVPAVPPPATSVLDSAQRLREVTYVWGGVSAYGIDCSGLTYLAWRRNGVALPRDAAAQAAATTPLPDGAERPGDLYFFARPGQRVHHVGIVTGRHEMLHACYNQRLVVVEPLPEERMATLVGAHRVPG